jgi:hypothetical protein
MPPALLAAMTRCRFAAGTESRCAGAAGASGFKHGFVACIVAAWTESCGAGAFGVAEQKHGFVTCMAAWTRPCRWCRLRRGLVGRRFIVARVSPAPRRDAPPTSV